MAGGLGLHGVVVGFLLVVFLLIRRQWRSGAARKEEVMRLDALASEESAAAEVRAVVEYGSASNVYRCAVCLCFTNTRCSQCKAIRYCSSKCQILHWRRGHKDECHPPSSTGCVDERDKLFESNDSKEVYADFSSSEAGNEPTVKVSSNGIHKGGSDEMQGNSVYADVAPDASGIRQSMHKIHPRSLHCQDNNGEARVSPRYEEVDFASECCRDKAAASFSDLQQQKYCNKKPSRSGASSKMLNTDNPLSSKDWEVDSDALADRRARSLSFGASAEPSSSAPNAQAATSSKSVLTAKVSHKPNMSHVTHGGLKTSVRKVVQHFRPSKFSKSFYLFRGGDDLPRKSNCKISFPYELFVKLYSCDGVELHPFGLLNCGNSCYANAVLQCLAFTRPLTSYFVRGLHSKTSREGKSPLSPIKILSKIQKIGKHLGPGREEDAHEFLRYAVDKMQHVFLKEVDVTGSFAEETTLIGLTFGGYLHSKINCMKCLLKSERCERMMDLTVEIGGEIGSLEEALAQFTANEILDEENKYHCSRCKSYEKAKKRLTILEAPNILTIVLKRFQSDNFEKLNKPIQFPEVLDVAPYMSISSNGSPLYNLYAVVVHLDVINTAFSGHYVCYVKTLKGDWFRVDDSTVMPVELETVLLEAAYMLLYARHSPSPPSSLRKTVESPSRRSNARNSEAIPSGHNNNSTTPRTDHRSASKHENVLLFQPGDWRPHAVQRIPVVDSSSESSSLLSMSDVSSCSTTSTKDSRVEDLSDFLFGGVEPDWYSRFVSNNDTKNGTFRGNEYENGVRYGEMSYRRTSSHGSAQTF